MLNKKHIIGLKAFIGLGNIWLQPPWFNNSTVKSCGKIFSKPAEEQ